MKVHILYKFEHGPWGGGNQFLKAIRKYLINKGAYTDNHVEADVILINSHHNIRKALAIKRQNHTIRFVHRIDGPIFYYRDDGYYLDKMIFKINKVLADGTIFQSQYTRSASSARGIDLRFQDNRVILNAPDPTIFYTGNERKISGKIRLIATSWSGNIKKGFDVYRWLDNNLDFTKYQFVFIGNTPIKFKNIIHKKPMRSEALAEEMRDSDIFIFASKIESCSNSLLEALHCSIPVIAHCGSSNPEIVKDGGELFSDPEEIPNLLTKIVANYSHYQGNIHLPFLDQVGESYYRFIENILNKPQLDDTFKRMDWFANLRTASVLTWWMILRYLTSRARALFKGTRP